MSVVFAVDKIRPEQLQFTIKQDKNFIIIKCSHPLGKDRLKDYYQNNRFFRNAFITARIEDTIEKRSTYWLVDYEDFETCLPARIAKREMVELHSYFYDDKIILSKNALRL